MGTGDMMPSLDLEVSSMEVVCASVPMSSPPLMRPRRLGFIFAGDEDTAEGDAFTGPAKVVREVIEQAGVGEVGFGHAAVGASDMLVL